MDDYLLLRFYVHENHRVHGKLLWHWLLEEANGMGIAGGSAFRAMAGFGANHIMREERFFELQGTLMIEVQLIVTEAQAKALIDRVSQEKVNAVYALIPARFGVIGHAA